MDIFENIESKKDENDVNKIISEVVDQMRDITEFSNSELKSISLCLTDRFLAEMLKYYISNKKHIKRKYAKELIKILEKLTQITQIGGSVQ
jgi:isocitrate dehydrogenase